LQTCFFLSFKVEIIFFQKNSALHYDMHYVALRCLCIAFAMRHVSGQHIAFAFHIITSLGFALAGLFASMQCLR
jgi:hypothetical protein